MELKNKQVGGDHYKEGIQPFDYIEANNLDFFAGNVVKYVTRHSKKNGAEDVQKAIHYLEEILAREYKMLVTPGSYVELHESNGAPKEEGCLSVVAAKMAGIGQALRTSL